MRPLLAVACGLMLVGCSGAEPDAVTPTAAPAPQSTSADVAEVPSDWVETSDVDGTYHFSHPDIFVEAPESQESGPYLVSVDGTRTISVVTLNANKRTTLDQVDAFIKQTAVDSGGTVGEFTESTLGGEPARQVDFTVPQGGTVLRFQQRHAIHGDHVYTFALNTAAEGDFPPPDFEQIFDSFTFDEMGPSGPES